MIPPVGFDGAGLDRADALRQDRDALERALNDPAARLLAMAGVEPLAAPDGGLHWRPLADVPLAAELVLLGLRDGIPHFAMVPGQPTPPAAITGSWHVAASLLPDDAAIFATARSLTDWHVRHRFCARCGAATRIAKGGWQRACPTCGAEHFPRVDPVVIMLAEHDGRVLVGRQPRYPRGRYSALAGFVEPGESIERAVARELFEEAGLVIDDVRYVASQPWPYPSSLMIACLARAGSDRLIIDRNELEDAFWVDRAGVRAALDGASDAPFIAPPPLAIAHSLFLAWLADVATIA